MQTLMASYGISSTWTMVNTEYYPKTMRSSITSGIDYEREGLPDIQGTLTNIGSNNSDASAKGAFSVSQGSNTYGNTNSGNHKTNITFKASDWSTVYGNSTTVTPRNYAVFTWYRTA